MAAKKVGTTKKSTAKKASGNTKTKKTTAKPVKNTKATEKRPTPKAQKPSPDKPSDIYTAAGVRLTVREAKFIDKYVETGNGRQAVIEAGYTGLPSPVATKLLKKDYIKEEIQYRMDQHTKDSIASREEIMQFWTDMMRGKILDQFDMPTTNADKLKAAAELAKRGMDIEDRIKERNSTTAPEIKISLDWGGHTSGTEE